MTNIQKLTALGQSLWYDNIHRRLLKNGDLAAWIASGEIRGVTSNPSIFHQSISNTHEYDDVLNSMAWAGWESEAIFWQLAIEDIRRTCDLFIPLYEETSGMDGFVSLEVHPSLAYNAGASLAQVKSLWGHVDRPNLMIKIPATETGLPAIRSSIASGISVNATLIFSIERYREVMEATLSGLEDYFFENGRNRSCPSSVASFFISRMDTKVDLLLPKESPLRGKAAISNARLAYAAFLETFSGPRWEKLARAGARPQRPLWASTSTKNPAYPDTLYVDELIGANTVNTVPPDTLVAFRDHGKAALTITHDLDGARRVLAELEAGGISIANLTRELEDEGVRAFADSFSTMLAAIESRRKAAVESLGSLATNVRQRADRFQAEAVPARLWDMDPSLWTNDPKSQEEIRKRLGWLRLPETSRARIITIQAVADEIHNTGIHKILLLGMGGSSLAPEVLSLVFKDSIASSLLPDLEFAILDSTDPAQVVQAAMDFPPVESLYIVSSKSGSTAEVNAALDYFWHLSSGDGSRFVAITDPGTPLEILAKRRSFRATLLTDPTVGGRFSVLADFGLLPMALMGMDIARVLDSAAEMMNDCGADNLAAENPGLMLGAIMGEAAVSGRDKLTLIADPQLAPFGSWLEQLIAESSGKQGRGIIVVDGEPPGRLSDYQYDRLFIYLKNEGMYDKAVDALIDAGHSVLVYKIPNAYTLVSEFFRWEIATVAACHILGVNAFDQPDVQDNKSRTVEMMTEYARTGRLDDPVCRWEGQGRKVFTNQDLSGNTLEEILEAFLGLAGEGDYIAINAFVPRNYGMLADLNDFRLRIRAQTGRATTLGFGPRFLHSTGQLHKGGPDSGLFLQITADPLKDIEIPKEGITPGKGITFGVLERAQALGDFAALAARSRRILRLHLPSPEAVRGLGELVK